MKVRAQTPNSGPLMVEHGHLDYRTHQHGEVFEVSEAVGKLLLSHKPALAVDVTAEAKAREEAASKAEAEAKRRADELASSLNSGKAAVDVYVDAANAKHFHVVIKSADGRLTSVPGLDKKQMEALVKDNGGEKLAKHHKELLPETVEAALKAQDNGGGGSSQGS